MVPPDTELDHLAALLNGSKRVTLLCGAGCAGAREEVIALADRLGAPAVHTLRGKEHVEAANSFDVGMTGLIGFSSGYAAMRSCDTLVMLGTDFPYRNFYPAKAAIVQIDRDPTALGKRANLAIGLAGDVGDTVRALLPRLEVKRDRSFLEAARRHYVHAREGLDELAKPSAGGRPIHPQYLTSIIDRLAAPDAIFTADVGTRTVWAARYLTMNGKRRLLGSFNHGSMANALPQAIGAQATFPGRQVVSLSGDGGFSMLMGDFLSLAQLQLPVKVVIYDNASLAFVAIEMKANGFLDTGVDLKNREAGARHAAEDRARAGQGLQPVHAQGDPEQPRRRGGLHRHRDRARHHGHLAREELQRPSSLSAGSSPVAVSCR